MLKKQDRTSSQIIRAPVQDVPLETFQDLGENDILFIDSSHVAKVGSDLTHLIFRVLPCLAPGVLVHFHDIFWPFEYPREWLIEGRAWNESYFLRAFLAYNNTFEMLYFNSYMAERHQTDVAEHLPLCLCNPGGSLWIRRVEDVTVFSTSVSGSSRCRHEPRRARVWAARCTFADRFSGTPFRCDTLARANVFADSRSPEPSLLCSSYAHSRS